MGAQSFTGVGNSGNSTLNISTTTTPSFSPIGGPSPMSINQTSPTQATCRGGVTLKGMTQQFGQITGSAGQTATLTSSISINGASTPGNQSCAMSATVTSTPFSVSDTTHSDAITDGETYGILFTNAGGTATGIISQGIAFEQDSAGVNYVPVVCWANPLLYNTSLNRYLPFTGTLALTATEANSQVPVAYGVTLDHLQVQVSSNGLNGLTVNTRINGASGNVTVSIPSGATSAEDTSHTDALSTGDMVNYQLSNTGGTNVSFDLFYARLISASAQQSGLYAAADGNNTNISGPAAYNPFIGGARCDSVIREVVTNTPLSGVLSLLTYTMQSSTSTSNVTVSMQLGSVGSVTGNQALTFGSTIGSQVTMADTTHSDSLTAGIDQFVLGVTGSAASTVHPQAQSIMFSAPAPAGGAHPSNMLLMDAA